MKSKIIQANSYDSNFENFENNTQVLNNEILGFFDSVLKSNAPKKLKESLISEKQSPNILYLTSDCQMDCDYCYQAQDRKNHFEADENYIKNFIDSVVKKEPNKISTIVLFGGEPFLKYNQMIFAIKYMASLEHKFAISTTTNGLLLDLKKYNFLKSFVSNKDNFSLEISYDGCGQHRRTFNGISTKTKIEELLEILPKSEISIRYTIHKDNCENALKDIIELCLKNYKKIIVNFYEQELEKFINIQEYKNKLIQQTEYIFEKFRIPVCHLNCKVCLGCNYKDFENINYGNFVVTGNVEKFNHFEILGTQKFEKIGTQN